MWIHLIDAFDASGYHKRKIYFIEHVIIERKAILVCKTYIKGKDYVNKPVFKIIEFFPIDLKKNSIHYCTFKSNITYNIHYKYSYSLFCNTSKS